MNIILNTKLDLSAIEMNLADFLEKSLLVCLIFNLISLNTDGLKVLKLQDDKNRDFVDKLYNVFKNLDTQKRWFNKNERESFTDTNLNEDEQESNKNILNKVFVKRLVPHNYETGNYEYDALLKTLFKPLIRVDRENKKIALLDNNRILSTNKLPNYLIKTKDNYDIIEIPLKGAVESEDDYLIQPSKVYFDEKVTANKIIKDVKSYMRNNNAKKLKQLKYSLLNILGKGDRTPKLRSIVYIPPGDHGNISVKVHLDDAIHPEHKLKEGQPLYSFWNYWTYDKEIFQDNCKGNLVQWGNLCIQPMPH